MGRVLLRKGPSPDAVAACCPGLPRSRGREPVDRLGVAEVDQSVRCGLHRVDAPPGGCPARRSRSPTRRRGRRSARRDGATPVFTSPKNRSALRPGLPRPQPSQNASPVMPIVPTNQSFGRCRGVGPLLFVFPGAFAAAVLVRPPSEVPAADDQVDLVVAFGAVLGLPQPVRLRVEREPEGVADAEREHAAARDRVVRRHASGRRHPQDLPAEVARGGPGRSSCRDRRRRSRRACRRVRTGCARRCGTGSSSPAATSGRACARVPLERVTFTIWFSKPFPVDRVDVDVERVAGSASRDSPRRRVRRALPRR